jgi:hypothetical protein
MSKQLVSETAQGKIKSLWEILQRKQLNSVTVLP